MRPRLPIAAAIACALAARLLACDGPVEPFPPVDGDDCPSDELWGNFSLWTDGVEGGFEGAYFDGPSPLLQQSLLISGDCVFHGFDPMPHCEPGCDPPLVCGVGDVCLDWPAALDVGTLEIAGTTPPLTVEPGFENRYYTDTFAGLIDPDGTYTLTVPGSSPVDPFTLTVGGVSPFADHSSAVTLTPGSSLDIHWTPADDGAQVVVEVGADHHAGTNAYARCETTDAAGQLTIPATVLDRVLAAGAGGLGSTTLVRYRASTTPTTHACATFATYTKEWLDVTVE